MKDLWMPLLILGAIITIALTGGTKNAAQINNSNGSTVPSPAERQLTTDEIAYNLQNTQYKAQDLQKQLAVEQEAKISSQYKNKITMSWGSWSNTDANQEYLQIDANYSNTAPINITGWKLTSTSTQQTIIIPQSTNLYFVNSANSDENIWLAPGERAYIITGRSPIGSGFHANVCSGYFNQTYTFIPSLYTTCPSPRDEDLKSIPRTPNNNNCFDLIDSLSSCHVGPTLNNTYSYECQQFVENKFNYKTCVETHKDDTNFYSPKVWYVYLKRDQVLWQPKRETVILYDGVGKVVQKISR